MRCVIVLNGEKTCGFEFEKGDRIIACDAAYGYLKDIGITPDEIIGDFDSLGYVPEGAKRFPVEKDMTDGELAVEAVLGKDYDEVVFIGFGGKREDHFLGNLSLLVKCVGRFKNCYAVTDRSIITVLDRGEHRFTIERGTVVSMFAFNDCLVEKSEGLKYPYDNTLLKNDSTLGISNVVVKENVLIAIKKGFAFFIENR